MTQVMSVSPSSVEGQLNYIDIWDIEEIKGIPNRELNKEIIDSIRASLETFEDIKKIDPIHVIQGSRVGLQHTSYGLINGFHRFSAYHDLYADYLHDNGIDPEELDEDTPLPPCLIPVIVRTDINSRDDIIKARWEDNRKHGSPPTAKERRAYTLFLAEKYRYAEGFITQTEIAKITGLDRTTVNKILKKYQKLQEMGVSSSADSAEGEDTEGSSELGYRAALTSYASDMVNKVHLFFKHEKAFFSLLGNSERDLKHRVKMITQEMVEKQYSPQEVYDMGFTLLRAYENMTGKQVINRSEK